MFRRRVIRMVGGFVGISGLLRSATAADNKTGEVKMINPPDNDGTSPGTGHIEKIADGVRQGRPYFVFHTPDDNGGVPLPEETRVRFTANGQRATNIELDEPVARCSVSDTEVKPDEQVVIDASDSNAELVRFDVDGDGDFDRTNDNDFKEAVRYSDFGTYTPVVRAEIDQQSDTQECQSITVEQN